MEPFRVADAAAVEDVQRAVAGIANIQIAGIGPGRAGAVHRRRARRAGIGADVAGRVADAAAVEDAQRTVAQKANKQIAGIGPGRAGAVHRRDTCSRFTNRTLGINVEVRALEDVQVAIDVDALGTDIEQRGLAALTQKAQCRPADDLGTGRAELQAIDQGGGRCAADGEIASARRGSVDGQQQRTALGISEVDRAGGDLELVHGGDDSYRNAIEPDLVIRRLVKQCRVGRAGTDPVQPVAGQVKKSVGVCCVGPLARVGPVRARHTRGREPRAVKRSKNLVDGWCGGDGT